LASTQDLKRRVRSITNTRKLTRAMELVASARLRRAQQRIEAMRPYADRMLELMAGVSQAAGAVRLPLLERRETVEHVAIVPVTGDRGLAGAFNAQVLRRAFALMREVQADGQQAVFFRRGRRPVRRFASAGSRWGRRGPASVTSRPTATRRRWPMRSPRPSRTAMSTGS
jgi:F-type H+-transporting ATPase subunit gamma